MGGSLLVILVLVVVMAATIVVSLFVLRRVGDSAERRADVLRAEVASRGEEWEIPLAGAVYQSGGTWPHAARATECSGSPTGASSSCPSPATS